MNTWHTASPLLRWEVTLKKKIDCTHDFGGVAVCSKKELKFQDLIKYLKESTIPPKFVYSSHKIFDYLYLTLTLRVFRKKKKILNRGDYLHGKESRNALFWPLSYKNVLLLDWTISNCFFYRSDILKYRQFQYNRSEIELNMMQMTLSSMSSYLILVKMCPT